MKSIVKVSSFVFGAFMALSLPAMAQEPPPGGEMAPPPQQPPVQISTGGMGSQGQIVISSDIPFLSTSPVFYVVRTSMSGTDTMPAVPGSTTVTIAPSGDYFVAPNISVGATVGYQGGSNTTRLGISVRGGYSIMLTDVISVWPRLGIGYAHLSIDGGGSSSAIPLIVDVPVLWHPASHFFLGAGFLLGTDLTSSGSVAGMSFDLPKTTNVGVTTMIGGYFGG
jgi:hypothetical protein